MDLAAAATVEEEEKVFRQGKHQIELYDSFRGTLEGMLGSFVSDFD